MKKIVLLGPPGAGKGTISELLVENNKLTHISVGEILRENISKGTELGKIVNKYISKGNLVPNDIIIDVVNKRLSEDDCKNQYLLDGYPRTLAQAQALEIYYSPNFVINIELSEDLIIDRLIGRRMCKECDKIYHISNIKNNMCPDCGSQLYQRKDDTEEVVKNRIKVYEKETEPLIEFYTKLGKIININGSQAKEKVYSDINKYI